jgi:hypothetical protein
LVHKLRQVKFDTYAPPRNIRNKEKQNTLLQRFVVHAGCGQMMWAAMPACGNYKVVIILVLTRQFNSCDEWARRHMPYFVCIIRVSTNSGAATGTLTISPFFCSWPTIKGIYKVENPEAEAAFDRTAKLPEFATSHSEVSSRPFHMTDI